MLNAEIMARYGLIKDWRTAGFYETENHRQITHTVRAGIGTGRLIAVTGPVGIGKTVFLHRLQDEIAREKKVTVAESLSVDKARTTVPTLISALFYDLSREKSQRSRPKVRSGSGNFRNWSPVLANLSRCSWMKPMICTARL